eukprot:6586199-Pyramimonas_sp.AAC.1
MRNALVEFFDCTIHGASEASAPLFPDRHGWHAAFRAAREHTKLALQEAHRPHPQRIFARTLRAAALPD